MLLIFLKDSVLSFFDYSKILKKQKIMINYEIVALRIFNTTCYVYFTYLYVKLHVIDEMIYQI